MRKFLMGLVAALIAIASVLASAGTSTAATAGDGDFSFTVVSTDFDHSEAQFSIKDSTFIKVNGSEQVSWEVENWTGTISPKAIQKAPRIHTECTQANRRTQSQQIWRMTHHATVVIVLPGSCLWNRGKHDNIMMGFDWHVTSPAILVGDKHHRYRHGFSLVRNRSQVAADEKVVGKVKLMGKAWLIVRKCKNFIGGPVDVYVPNAVQVHYANDIKKSGIAVADTRVDGTVTFNITCPNGANFNTLVHTWANGHSEAAIEFTERTRVSVLDAHSVELTSKAVGNGEASATSNAGSEITVSGSCGNNPQPEHANPVGELFFGEHAVDLYGTMPVFGRVRASDGATPVMGTPQVTPSDLGTVSNWRPVPTNKDGAACEAGWVCYEGTFRVIKNGTPGTYVYGTMVSHMSDSMGGSSNTDSKTFSVYYANHPET